MVRKVLQALTPEWEKKTTIIEEGNDLFTLMLENLVGNLMAYEVQVQERKKDEQSHPKKKVLTFKTSFDSEDSHVEEEDLAYSMLPSIVSVYAGRDPQGGSAIEAFSKSF